MADKLTRETIKKLIDEYTTANTVSREAARQALAKEGIYTKAGKLTAKFGGTGVKASRTKSGANKAA